MYDASVLEYTKGVSYMPSDRLRKERRLQGVCRCGKPFMANLKMCQECRDRRNERHRELRAIRRESGLCFCGKPARPGLKSCGGCAAKHVKEVSAAYKKKIAAGFCSCGQEPVPGRSKCERCHARWQHGVVAKRAAGICYSCTKPARGEGVLCETCLSRGAKAGSYTGIYRKRLVMDHYGGKCACCGEDAIEFLTIDHINNDGAEHRKTVLSHASRNGRSVRLYSWLVQEGFPSGFQVLCMNCNTAKGFYGRCPCPERNSARLKETAGTLTVF